MAQVCEARSFYCYTDYEQAQDHPKAYTASQGKRIVTGACCRIEKSLWKDETERMQILRAQNLWTHADSLPELFAEDLVPAAGPPGLADSGVAGATTFPQEDKMELVLQKLNDLVISAENTPTFEMTLKLVDEVNKHITEETTEVRKELSYLKRKLREKHVISWGSDESRNRQRSTSSSGDTGSGMLVG